MNKKLYLIIISTVTVFCIILGSAYHLCGWLFGDLFGISFVSGKSEESGRTNSGQGRNSYAETHEAFDSLMIDASVMEITIETGSEYFVSYDCVSYLTPEIRTEGNVLIIEQPSVHKLSSGSNHCELTITIPSDVTLRSADIQADVGDISLTNISSEEITLLADVGNIEADSCTFTYADAEADVGAVEFDNCTLESCEISADVGAIAIEDCYFTDLELSGDLGDITVRTPLDLSNYNMELSVEMGSLKVNGNTYKKSYDQNGTSGKHLQIENALGNIDVEYGE